MESIIGRLESWAVYIRDTHGVNHWLFLGLMVVCGPVFYYSIYRLIRAAASRDGKALAAWSTIFLAATSVPYLYVLIFGRNLPWWVYVAFAALIGQGVYSLVKKIRSGRRTAGETDRGN